MQAGSLGLFIPSKPKRGRVGGGGGQHREDLSPKAEAGGRRTRPFPLGITRTAAAAAPPHEEGQGRASAPPRGPEAPGKLWNGSVALAKGGGGRLGSESSRSAMGVSSSTLHMSQHFIGM